MAASVLSGGGSRHGGRTMPETHPNTLGSARVRVGSLDGRNDGRGASGDKSSTAGPAIGETPLLKAQGGLTARKASRK